MVKNSTINILKTSIAETRRRLLKPVDRAIHSGKVYLKMSCEEFEPKYFQGNNKKSEAKDGAKDE